MKILLDYLYPVSYLVSLFALVAWFFVQQKPSRSRFASILFLGGFLVYLFSLSWSSGTTQYKLLILFRDMAVMIVTSQIFLLARRQLILTVILGLAAATTVYLSYFKVLLFTFPQVDTELSYEGGELLVALHDPEDLAHLQSQIGESTVSIEPAFTPASAETTDLDNVFIVDVRNDDRYALKRVFKHVERCRKVDWVEPNEVIPLEEPAWPDKVQFKKPDPVLNDPAITQQWHFGPVHMHDLHAFLTTSGLSPVKRAKIAIIDTGVDGKHEDLAANYISASGDSDTDNSGHGTHCAGIAAAVSNNGIGIASAAPSSDYVSVTGFKVTNAFGIITQRAIIEAMIDAADMGADVLSLSLGGLSDAKKQEAYRKTVEYVNGKGGIVVVAAGNASESAIHTSPANVKGVIAVSALDQNSRKATFSNSVQELDMGLAAPGVQIYSTLPGNLYGPKNGTSMATPLVSGTIALLKSFYPELTTKEAFYLLDKTGVQTNDGSETGKLIQPLKALQEILD